VTVHSFVIILNVANFLYGIILTLSYSADYQGILHSFITFPGLEKFNSDKSKCQEHFDVYKECKKKEVTEIIASCFFYYYTFFNILKVFVWILGGLSVSNELCISAWNGMLVYKTRSLSCWLIIFSFLCLSLITLLCPCSLSRHTSFRMFTGHKYL